VTSLAPGGTSFQVLAPEKEATAAYSGRLKLLDGSREPALADQPELDYTMAAEILLLIELVGEQG
jgi:hypothetical protein